MTEREFPEITLIRTQTNRGFSAANNQAIKLSKGRFLLLLNPDTLIQDNALLKCITFMDKHQDAGAIGVRMVNCEGRFLPDQKGLYRCPKLHFTNRLVRIIFR
jgi:O-antigen biosynthesis protein